MGRGWVGVLVQAAVLALPLCRPLMLLTLPACLRACCLLTGMPLHPALPCLQWVRLLGVEEGSDILAALRDERVVVVPGRICHHRAADPDFRCARVWKPPAGHAACLSPRCLQSPVKRGVEAQRRHFTLMDVWLALDLPVCCRCPYLRLSFATPPPEELEEGVRRLAAVLRRLRQGREQQG